MRKSWIPISALVVSAVAVGMYMATPATNEKDEAAATARNAAAGTPASGLPRGRRFAGYASDGNTVAIYSSAANRDNERWVSRAFVSTDSGKSFRQIDSFPRDVTHSIAMIADGSMITLADVCNKSDADEQEACTAGKPVAYRTDLADDRTAPLPAPPEGRVWTVVERPGTDPVFVFTQSDWTVDAAALTGDGAWKPVPLPAKTIAVCGSSTGDLTPFTTDVLPQQQPAPGQTIPIEQGPGSVSLTAWSLRGSDWKSTVTTSAPLTALDQLPPAILCSAAGDALILTPGRITRWSASTQSFSIAATDPKHGYVTPLGWRNPSTIQLDRGPGPVDLDLGTGKLKQSSAIEGWLALRTASTSAQGEYAIYVGPDDVRIRR